MKPIEPEWKGSTPDRVHKTIAQAAYEYIRTAGPMHKYGIEPEDLAQEGFLFGLQYGKDHKGLQIFLGRKYIRQFAAKAKRREIPKSHIFTDFTRKTPAPSRHLSYIHKDFALVDARDLLAFVLTRLNIPQWKIQIATDLITQRRTGAFWAKQRGCSWQRIFAIKQEFLEKSRKLLNITAA